MHSFRHSMRDRLRAVQCPAAIANQIGVWTTDVVGQGYGSGYPLAVVQNWLYRVAQISYDFKISTRFTSARGIVTRSLGE